MESWETERLAEINPMNVGTIREFCLFFPQATENLQWGDDLCFKIRGKIFTIVSLDDPRLCFKCTPEAFAVLIECEDIHPAPYVGRYNWVMLDRLDAVRWDELKELIRQSLRWSPRRQEARRPQQRPSPSSGLCRRARAGRRRRRGLEIRLLDRVGGQERPPHMGQSQMVPLI